MDKTFICLANSYKHGNRCIAGIEIDHFHLVFRHFLNL